MPSLTSRLGAVDRLPETLVPAASRSRLFAAAGRLPATLSSRLFLECRLRGDNPRLDLSLHIEESGREIIAGRNPAIRLAPEVSEHPVWARLVELCREWSDPGSRVATALKGIWLEFDLVEAPPTADGRAPLVPAVFVELASTDRGAAQDQFERAVTALEPLIRGRLSPAVPPALGRCFEMLPGRAYVPYVGVMFTRGAEGLRLCVANLDESEIPAYLRSIGWLGDGRLLREGMARTRAVRRGARVERVAIVDVDVGHEIHPRLGLEYVLSPMDQVRGLLRETAHIEHLVDAGLCTPAKAEALLHWPGCSVKSFPHELWPSLEVRRVAHLKDTYEDGRVRGVKAYLSLRHSPWTRRGPGRQNPSSIG